MALFDLLRLTVGQLDVDLQPDLIGIYASRMVAPLREESRYAAFPSLTPSVTVAGNALNPSKLMPLGRGLRSWCVIGCSQIRPMVCP